MSGADDLSLLKSTVEQARAARDQSALLLVGSGVTIQATEGAKAASWGGLLDLGISRCEELAAERGLSEFDGGAARAKLKSTNVAEVIASATLVEQRLRAAKGTVFRDFLKQTVGSLMASRPEVLQALKELELPLLTTNYDVLLEATLGVQGMSWTSDGLVQEFLAGKRRSVLHVHGHYAEPDSVVLGAKSYERIAKDKKFQNTLRSLMQSRSLIFVGLGSGLDDPNFSKLIEWVIDVKLSDSRHHFLLLRDAEAQARRPHMPLNSRIHVVGYGASHADLVPFLQRLAGKLPGVSSQAHASDPRLRERVRHEFLETFRTAADADAFLLDCYHATRQRFTAGMDLQARLNLLLDLEDPADVLSQMRRYAGTEDAASDAQAKERLWEALFRLDRITQWRTLLGGLADATDSNQLVLLSGHEDQSPTLFVQRMEQRLVQEHRARVVLLPLWLSGKSLSSPTSWAIRLANQLSDTLKLRDGRLPDLLKAATADQPLVIIPVLRPNPLMLLADLEPDTRTGLSTFLETLLPEALSGLRRVTVMLPLSHDDRVRAPLDWALSLAVRRWNRAPFNHLKLDPLSWPPWDDVETYLRSYPEEIDLDYVLGEAKVTYEGLSKQRTTFQRLTEKIDEIVLKSLHKRKKS